jgi:hypothetical protein
VEFISFYCILIDDVTGICHWRNPSGHIVALGLTQSLTEMNTGSISWGWKRPVCRTDNLTIFMFDCLEIWELQTSGDLKTCPGFALHLFLINIDKYFVAQFLFFFPRHFNNKCLTYSYPKTWMAASFIQSSCNSFYHTPLFKQAISVLFPSQISHYTDWEPNPVLRVWRPTNDPWCSS